MVLRWFFLWIILFFLVGCKDPVQRKCQQVCKFFISCVETKRSSPLAGPIRDKGFKNCMNGCGRFQSYILTCYDESQNSCRGMMECLKDSGLGE